MAEKKRKPDSAARHHQRSHHCSPELNGCGAKGTSNNPGPAARRMTAAAVAIASCDASERLFYEEIRPKSPDAEGCAIACPNHPTSPRLSRAAFVATAALVVGLITVVAVGVVIWHEHQRRHHPATPQLVNASALLHPFKGVGLYAPTPGA